jgi:uncharacterized protein YkwD
MAKFFLFISSIVLAFSLLFFGKESFFPENNARDIAVEQTPDGSAAPAEALSRGSSTTTSPKKITPVVFVPTKDIEAIAPKKAEPKVAEPLVRYSEGKPSPGTLLSSEVAVWTNTYRAENNLKPLARNEKLDAAAIIKVHDMFDRQYFEHVSPTGKNSADLVSGVGYEYLWVGENLAVGIFSDEKDLVDAWMASPGHRANILNAHFEEIGIGVDEGTYEGRHVWMAVQEFGKPASSCLAPELSLKTKIEQNRKKIDELSAQAAQLISEINALKNGDEAGVYNQKVSEYNILVAELNPLIQSTKTLIDMYNKEISEYNACIEG